MTDALPRTYSTSELADALGKSLRWVEEQARAGRFPVLRIGRERRFTSEHIERIFQILEQPEKGPAPLRRRARRRKSV